MLTATDPSPFDDGAVSPAQTNQLVAATSQLPSNVTVSGAFNAAPGRVIRSDSEIDTDDWTLVEVNYYLSLTSDRRGVALRILYRAHEGESNRTVTGSKTVLEIDSTSIYRIPSSDPRTIASIVGSTSGGRAEWYAGKSLFSFYSFPSFGPLSNINVRFDGDGGNDQQRMAISANFGVQVAMNPGAYIAGRVFDDRNVNTQDDGEGGLPRFVWIDSNQNGEHEGGELATSSDQNGNFRFNELYPGTYPIRHAVPNGWLGTAYGDSPFVATINGTTAVVGVRLGQVGVTPVRVEAVNPETNTGSSRLGVREGGAAQFRFMRANAQLPPARVYFNVLGDANADDYQAGGLSQGFVDFGVNEASKIIEIPISANDPVGGENHIGNEELVIQLDSDPLTPGFQSGPIGDYVRDAQGRWVVRPGGAGADRYHAVDPSAWEAVVEIVDVHDKFVSVETSDAIGFEGSGDLMSFRLRRSGEVDDELTVDLSLTGTASPGVDYALQLASGDGSLSRSGEALQVRFRPGSSELLLSLVPLNDPEQEGIEWAHAELVPSAGYTVTRSQDLQQVRLSLVDDEIASVMLRASGLLPDALRVTEAAGRARFTVDRGNLAYTDRDLIVNLQLHGGSTTASTGDYIVERVDRSGSVDVFTPLERTPGGFYALLLPRDVAYIELALRSVDDAVPESDERIEARLISGNYLNHPTLDRLELVIVDDDRPTVTIVAEDALAREGIDTATFLLGRGPQGLTEALTVRYAIDPSNMGTFGVDYSLTGVGVAADGLSVTFPPSVDEARVTLTARRDGVSESLEAVTLRLLPMNRYEVSTSALTPSSAQVLIGEEAPGTPHASFDWSMPPRYGVDANSDGRIDLPNTAAYANPGVFPVRLDASQSAGGIANYSWSILHPDGTQLTASGQITTVHLQDDTTYTVTLTASGSSGTHRASQLVHVNDILILGMGDSYASGEGSPDVQANNFHYQYNASFTSQLAQWADGLDSTMSDWHHAAHRSVHSQFSKVALDAENADTKTSVTFVNVAQSGAEVFDGLLRYLGRSGSIYDNETGQGKDGKPQNPTPQVPFAKSIVEDRPIDKLLLSIGGNDVGFADVLAKYIMRHRIQAAWGLVGLGHTVGLDDIALELQAALAELPAKYADIDAALRSTFSANRIDGKVFLAGYPFPGRDENGNVSGGILRDNLVYENGLVGSLPDLGVGTFWSSVLGRVGTWLNTGLSLTGLPSLAGPPLTIDEEEAQHALHHAAVPLEAAQRRSADALGWNFVEPSAAWITKGYSAAINGRPSFYRTVMEARRYQGGTWLTGGDGAMHPNEDGYRAYADEMNLRVGTDVVPTVTAPAEVTVVEGGAVTLSASASTPNVARIEWDLDFDGTFDPTPHVSGPTATFSAADLSYPASRRVVVRLIDSNGRAAFAETGVRVLNRGSGRYALEVPSVNAGEPFRLGLQRVRQAQDPVNHWRIDWGDGTSELVAGDWTSRSKVYTLAPGASTGTFDYRVWLTDAGGEVEVQGGTVVVVKDDPFPRVSVQAVGAAGNERGGDPITFRFTRSGQLNLPLSIAVAFSAGAGRASNGVDYVGADAAGVPTGSPVPLSVFFPVGQSTVDVRVVPVRDADEAEGAENVDLTILTSSLYAIVTSSAVAVIADGPSVERGGIEGFVFDDADGDRVRGAAESGLAGWGVVLDLDRDGVADAGEPVAMSDTSGRYEHPLQPSGVYQLLLVPRAGWVATLPTTIDAAKVLPGATTAGQDFAAARPVSVTGKVFSDANINGVQDAGEVSRSDVKVWVDLDDDGAFDAGEPSGQSASDGSYALAGARPGTFVVRAETSAQWTTTNGVDGGGLAVTALGGASVAGKDHGQRRVLPQLASLAASSGAVNSNDVVTLTVSGGDPWTSLVRFYRESNAQLGLQTGAGGDVEIGQDAAAGDGWGLTFRAGLAAGAYLFYAAADEGNGLLSPPAPFTFVSVSGAPGGTLLGVTALNRSVREGGSLAAVYEIRRTGANGNAVTVNLGLQAGAGYADGDDLYEKPTSVVIPAGQDAVRVVLLPVADGKVEPFERISLQVLAGVGYAVGEAGSAEVELRGESSPNVVRVTHTAFAPEGSVHVVRVGLSENVASSLSAGGATLRNATTGQTFSADLRHEYDPLTGVARFAVPSFNGGRLPDGTYRLTLSGVDVSDPFGNPLDGDGNGVGGDDYVFQFEVGNSTKTITGHATEGNQWVVRYSSGKVQVYHGSGPNPILVAEWPSAEVGELRFVGGAGDDRISLSSTLPPTKLVLDGGAGEDTLRITADNGSGVGGQFERLEVYGGANVLLNEDLSTRVVQVAEGSRLRLAAGAGLELRTGRLEMDMASGVVLDVNDGRLVVEGGDPRAIEAMVTSARNGAVGRWQGPGITSTAAQLQSLRGLAVGMTGADVIVRYTYNGDANLDGRINSDDYFRIDSGFLSQPTHPTYAQGDFNFDDQINSDDYFLVDSTFLGQGAPLAATSPARIAPALVHTRSQPYIHREVPTRMARRISSPFSDVIIDRAVNTVRKRRTTG